MSNWVILVIGLAIVGALIGAARKWGSLSAEKKMLTKNVDAAKTRIGIDNEVDQMDTDDLADELSRFVRKP